MDGTAFAFQLRCTDSGSAARRGTLLTPHGAVETPAFMPVGTQATVKGLTADLLRQTGASMILANTYHLALRPGAEVVHALGGLHQMMDWDGPILTDSGGFQIFSLRQLSRVDDRGVVFRSHIDGHVIELTPERAVRLQAMLGSDIAMVLDHVVQLPAAPDIVHDACRRTVAWAKRSRTSGNEDGTQLLFAIVQGGLDPELRRWCATQLVAMDFPGYAIGGLSVGERPDQMYATLEVTCPLLPAHRPRYLMGVGRPQDILAGIAHGVDLFDCVMPTRNARNALAFTDNGPVRPRNVVHRADARPVEPGCPRVACRHGRGYLRHLFMAREMLGPILLTVHNLTYYQRLVAEARQAIGAGDYHAFWQRKLDGWASGPEDSHPAPGL